MASLRHRNLRRYFSQGRQVFAESLRDFQQLVDLRPSNQNFVLRYNVLQGVLEGLIFLHGKGFYHGNLSRSCVQYRQGKTLEVKLSDYHFCQDSSVRQALPGEPLAPPFDIRCVGLLIH